MANDLDPLTPSALPLSEQIRQLIESARWADRQLAALVTEDDGNGAFIRGSGIELAGFGAGHDALRRSIRGLSALLKE